MSSASLAYAQHMNSLRAAFEMRMSSVPLSCYKLQAYKSGGRSTLQHYCRKRPTINMPNKKRTSSTHGRGKGKKIRASTSSKADDPPVHIPADILQPPDDVLDTPADVPETPPNDELHVPEQSRSPSLPREVSRESSVSSYASIDFSTASRLADNKGKKKKERAKKNPCNLIIAEEELMLEFIMDNPVLWNVKMTDYRRKDKKNKIWDEQAQQMDKTADTLKGWFRSLHDTHTRLDKKKSGDSTPNLTEREQWILSKFAFLKTVTRHRPEPMQSVS